MTDNSILLTYIIPVYNTERYVLKCLQSVVNQGLHPDQYEVLVVDDGSTDGSREVVKDFAADHPQVHLLTQANAGVSAARNLALDHARGLYVQFIDSDDYLEPGMMASLVQRAVDERLDVLQFNFKSIEPDGTELPSSDAQSSVASGIDYLREHRLTPYVWRFLVRRDYLEQRHLRFNTSLIVCEDGALITDFLLNAPRMAHDVAAPYCYVTRSDSAMNNPDPDHLRRRIFSQVDSAKIIDGIIKQYEASTGNQVPASVPGLRNVYLFFSMTKALTCGCVDEVVEHIKAAGLFPFPCVGPEADYFGAKWGIIHRLMMHPRLWAWLSRVYRLIR